MPRQIDQSKWTHIGEWQFNKQVFVKKYLVDADSGCYQWQGSQGPQGALFGVKKNLKPRMTQARRVAWMIEYNEDISHIELKHACQNNMCVNPAHMTTHKNKMQKRCK